MTALDPRWAKFLEDFVPKSKEEKELIDVQSPKFSFGAFNSHNTKVTTAGQSEGPKEVHLAEISGVAGVEFIRLYFPPGGSHGSALLPAFMYLHGGGYCFLSSRVFEPTLRKICAASQCIVIAPEYTLAREEENTKFPKSVNECYQVFIWIIENASKFNINPRRVFIGGDSCGSGLTTAVTLMALKERNSIIQPCGQILLSPFLIPTCDTPSYFKLGRGGYENPRHLAHFCWQVYQRTKEDINNPYFTPFKAESLKGLPRALIIINEHDPIQDDGYMYGIKLKNDGVEVVTVCYADTPHVHYIYDKVFPLEAKMVLGQIASFISFN